MSNDTSSIELVKVTETVLRAANAGHTDFIIFDVKTAITPNVKRVTAGDVILLRSVIASDLTSGEWISEPAGVISVENFGEATGIGYALALRGGQARVSKLLDETRRITVDLVRTPFLIHFKTHKKRSFFAEIGVT